MSSSKAASPSQFLEEADRPVAKKRALQVNEDTQLKLGDKPGRLEGQLTGQAVCDRDPQHKTVCFRSKQGKLFWRCEDEECQEKEGAFKGSGRLLGPDGQVRDHQPQQQPAAERKGQVTTGALLTLGHLSDRIGEIGKRLDTLHSAVAELLACVQGNQQSIAALAECNKAANHNFMEISKLLNMHPVEGAKYAIPAPKLPQL